MAKFNSDVKSGNIFDGIGNAWNSLPTWGKVVIGVGGAAAACIGTYKVIDYFSDGGSGGGGGNVQPQYLYYNQETGQHVVGPPPVQHEEYYAPVPQVQGGVAQQVHAPTGVHVQPPRMHPLQNGPQPQPQQQPQQQPDDQIVLDQNTMVWLAKVVGDAVDHRMQRYELEQSSQVQPVNGGGSPHVAGANQNQPPVGL